MIATGKCYWADDESFHRDIPGNFISRNFAEFPWVPKHANDTCSGPRLIRITRARNGRVKFRFAWDYYVGKSRQFICEFGPESELEQQIHYTEWRKRCRKK